MEIHEAGGKVELKLARRLTPSQMKRFLAGAANLGLETIQTSPIIEVDDPLSREENIAIHLERTYPPQSKGDFLGREHLWIIADALSIPRKTLGRLFGEMCFPIEASNRSRLREGHNKLYKHEDIGLVVKTREETNLVIGGEVSMRSAPHSSRQSIYRRAYPDAPDSGAVIQIEGFLRALADTDLIAKICSPGTREIIPAFREYLEKLIDPQMAFDELVP